MKEKLNIFWFRRDLRLEDNTGFCKALMGMNPVMPIFIFDTEIIENLPKDNYTQERLTESWMDFAYTIKKSDLDFFSTLSSFLPIIGEDGLVRVSVHNST